MISKKNDRKVQWFKHFSSKIGFKNFSSFILLYVEIFFILRASNKFFFCRISKYQVKKLSCLLYPTKVNDLVRFSKSMPLVREVNHINRIAFAPMQLPITTWRVSAILIIAYFQPLKPSIEPKSRVNQTNQPLLKVNICFGLYKICLINTRFDLVYYCGK